MDAASQWVEYGSIDGKELYYEHRETGEQRGRDHPPAAGVHARLFSPPDAQRLSGLASRYDVRHSRAPAPASVPSCPSAAPSTSTSSLNHTPDAHR